MSKTTNNLINLIALTFIIISGFGCGENSNGQIGAQPHDITEINYYSHGGYWSQQPAEVLQIKIGAGESTIIASRANCSVPKKSDLVFVNQLKKLLRESIVTKAQGGAADCPSEILNLTRSNQQVSKYHLTTCVSGENEDYLSNYEDVKKLLEEKLSEMLKLELVCNPRA